MSGEGVALSELFDFATIFAAVLETMLGQSVPEKLLTDSKSLFDVI